jgi:hypothetical protein
MHQDRPDIAQVGADQGFRVTQDVFFGLYVESVQLGLNVWQASLPARLDAHLVRNEFSDHDSDNPAQDQQNHGRTQRFFERSRDAAMRMPPERNQRKHSQGDMAKPPGFETI